MNYVQQINRAINYIETNLFDPLDTEQIAQEAGISKWYFQRIFRAMVGDTLKEYVLKRRLSLAALALAQTEKKIIDIAFEHGFESHEVFIRAFRRVFEQTPTRFREEAAGPVTERYKPKITTDYLSHLYQGITMEPNIKTLAAIPVVGRIGNIQPVAGYYEENQKVVTQLWRDFKGHQNELPPTKETEKIGMLTGLDKPGERSIIEYCAGLAMELPGRPPEGFVSRMIPPGEYAEFTHLNQGSQNTINHTYNYIYGSWLPKSGRERSAGPEVVFYPIDFHPSQTAEIKILIPLI